ncbi:MAG: hypothetical protein KJ634_00135 [Gammaproteobacteria bacterium]|nr:hypothetical protein [Gammaproteobacteria bacterium]MBU1414006.1 hypothetical protein [Gammaproteobacteria bacterium]
MKSIIALTLLAAVSVFLFPQDGLSQGTREICHYYIQKRANEKFSPVAPPPSRTCKHGQIYKAETEWRCATVAECESTAEPTICNGQAKNMFVKKEGAFFLGYKSEAAPLPPACR